MSKIIAVSGKGGVGKTTLSGLLVAGLINKKCTPVLAVDADPNICLDAVLGVKAAKTIGGVREEAREIAGKGMSAGISKQDLLEMKIAESLIEADDFDLIAMGRPEGPGCYCYANNVLKSALAQIAESYPYIVLDNEAGLENLSRRIVQQVDVLILVTDPSKRGIETLRRLYEMTAEMEIEYKKLVIVVNRQRKNEISDYAQEVKEKINADMIFALPDDEKLGEFAEDGRTLLDFPTDNRVSEVIDEIIKSVV